MNKDEGKVDLKYIGEYSSLDCYELGTAVKRGETVKAPVEFAAKMLALRPGQWECADQRAIDAAKPLIEAEEQKRTEFAAELAKQVAQGDEVDGDGSGAKLPEFTESDGRTPRFVEEPPPITDPIE